MNNMSKIKILHILWSGEIGGTEEYVISLLEYLDHSKYEFYLCFLSRTGPISEEAAKKIRNITFIGMKNGLDLRRTFRLFQMLRKEQFDVIHSHSTNLLANLIISLFRKPEKVFSEHVSPGAKDAFEKRKLFYRIFSNLYKRIIAISETVKRTIVEDLNIDPKKIDVVHNGVQFEKFEISLVPPQEFVHLKKTNRYIMGFVGRMADFKRPQLFIEIAAELLKKNKQFFFIMVGDGPEMENCKKIINNYNINEYFELTGFRRDIPSILKLFDAFIFTSECEGFGIVIIEAMAMGVPVFAVSEGAVTEIVTHKEDGFLFNTTDPERMADQIIESFEAPQLMDKVREQCRARVHSKFSIEASARKIERVYKEALLNEQS